MRLGRLAVAGLTAGVVAGFVIALLLPRRRRTILDLTVHDASPEVGQTAAVEDAGDPQHIDQSVTEPEATEVVKRP